MVHDFQKLNGYYIFLEGLCFPAKLQNVLESLLRTLVSGCVYLVPCTWILFSLFLSKHFTRIF